MSDKNKIGSKYSAPALEKGLDILGVLSKEIEGLSVSNIANKLNRSMSEIFRIVKVLEAKGFIAPRPDSDLYYLTLKMFMLSTNHPPIHRLTSKALPEMEKLANKIDQSCHLVIYIDGKGVIIAQKKGSGNRVYSVRVGSDVPLLSTCSGQLMLAYADESKREEMLSWLNPRESNAIDFDSLEEDLLEIRSQGCHYRPSPQVQGVQDMCYPIFDASETLVAILAVPFLEHLDGSHPIDNEYSRKYLCESAKEISKLLGYNK